MGSEKAELRDQIKAGEIVTVFSPFDTCLETAFGFW